MDLALIGYFSSHLDIDTQAQEAETSQTMIEPLVSPWLLPPCPSFHTANPCQDFPSPDLRDGAWHLGEVLVPTGNMASGVVTDTGLWASLGSYVPSWTQDQHHKQQQHEDPGGAVRPGKGERAAVQGGRGGINASGH